MDAGASTWHTAHPRVCGENGRMGRRLRDPLGSSPRVRGKQRRFFLVFAVAGLIPARAGKTTRAGTALGPAPAHPRACGENQAHAIRQRLVRGSSPRVRGKLEVAADDGPAVGLIPARAGKTGGRPLPAFGFWAHPRACGENPTSPADEDSSVGSSPRVRGKQASVKLLKSIGGLIPARAGKTKTSTAPTLWTPAHPRACGENVGPRIPVRGRLGSSPRVRGKPDPLRPPRHRRGLIPARAGKTHRGNPRRRAVTAHPRACGENMNSKGTVCPRFGSSPRVRGKRRHRRRDEGRPGLIPARAGKTTAAPRAASPTTAHPRACGENGVAAGGRQRLRGSSPRVRGKHRPNHRDRLRGGLIPARAGKTCGRRALRFSASAHPRACGENPPMLAARSPTAGSSPRVRGKRWRRPPRSRAARLIPARAGKTCSAGFVGAFPRAHPHACGENVPIRASAALVVGSSPRVRGKPAARCASAAPRTAHPRACGENAAGTPSAAAWAGSSPRVRGKLRGAWGTWPDPGLIPARAGKTASCLCRPGRTTAHPRACGENAMHACARATAAGSSPRVRGKPVVDIIQRLAGRLIPARAGKTCRRGSVSNRHQAHPRACGENFQACSAAARVAGSSPRVRGKLVSQVIGVVADGLIPARAGKTRRRGSRTRAGPAHPRACGENQDQGVLDLTETGSSPRVRGKLPAARGHTHRCGLIPARAGKTRASTGSRAAEPAHPRACGENITGDNGG